MKKVGDLQIGKSVQTTSRVFYGQYKISVSVNGKVVTTRNVSIKKSERKKNLKIDLLQTVIG